MLTTTEVLGQAEAMQRQRFLQAFFQTARGGFIQRREFGDQAVQRAFRICVRTVRMPSTTDSGH